jgi:hypothetical protein
MTIQLHKRSNKLNNVDPLILNETDSIKPLQFICDIHPTEFDGIGSLGRVQAPSRTVRYSGPDGETLSHHPIHLWHNAGPPMA